MRHMRAAVPRTGLLPEWVADDRNESARMGGDNPRRYRLLHAGLGRDRCGPVGVEMPNTARLPLE